MSRILILVSLLLISACLSSDATLCLNYEYYTECGIQTCAPGYVVAASYNCPSGIKILCQLSDCCEGFWGVSCTERCPGFAEGDDNLDNVCSGHGTCNDGKNGDGSCACNLGYTNEVCSSACPGLVYQDSSRKRLPAEIVIDVCSGHGTCDVTISIAQCECAEGYYGEDCSETCFDTPNPLSDNHEVCNGHGTCEEGCLCANGYFGQFCLHECPGGIVNPCNNRGVCHMLTGVCNCEDYFTGESCQDCLCNNGQCDAETGVCVSGTCHAGFSGMFCNETVASSTATVETSLLDQSDNTGSGLSIPIVAGGAGGGFFLFLLLLLLLVLRRRRNRDKHTPSSSSMYKAPPSEAIYSSTSTPSQQQDSLDITYAQAGSTGQYIEPTDSKRAHYHEPSDAVISPSDVSHIPGPLTGEQYALANPSAGAPPASIYNTISNLESLADAYATTQDAINGKSKGNSEYVLPNKQTWILDPELGSGADSLYCRSNYVSDYAVIEDTPQDDPTALYARVNKTRK